VTCGEDRCLVPKCVATAHVACRALVGLNPNPRRLKCEEAGPPARQAWTPLP